MIDIRYRERGDVRIVEDDGGPVSGPLAVVTQLAAPDGRVGRRRTAAPSTATGSTSRRALLTPLVWIGAWVFWQWRAFQLSRLAPAGGLVNTLESSTGGDAPSRCTPRCARSTIPAEAHAHWCAVRQQMFLTHPASAAAVELDGRAVRPGLAFRGRDSGCRARLVRVRDRHRRPGDLRSRRRRRHPGRRNARRVASRGLRRRDLPADPRHLARHLRRRPLPARHDQGRRPGVRRGDAGPSCSTSTSPTTRRARTTPRGRARWRRRATGSTSPIPVGERYTGPH